MNEYPRATTWLTTTLGGIPGVLEVSEHPGRQGMPYPAITFSLMAPEDLTVIGEDRVWAELLFLVTAINRTSSTKSLQAIADEIDTRLHGTEGPAGADAVVISSTRDSLFQQSDTVDGISYRRLGGLYRLLVQPVAA